MSAAPDAIVVGAGVLGLFTGLHLARRGLRVTMLEARCVGAGASGHSGALIRSTCETEVEIRLAARSLKVFADWPRSMGGDAGFKAVGALELVSPEGVDDLLIRVARQQRLGVAVHLLYPDQLREVAPSVRCTGVARASFQHDAGYCEPTATLHSLFTALRAAGVKFIGDSPVDALVVQAGRCTGVEIKGRTLAAGAVVVAAGAGASTLLKMQHFGLTPCLSTLAVFYPGAEQSSVAAPTVLDHVQDAWFRPTSDGGVLVGMGLGRSKRVAHMRDGCNEMTSLRETYAAAAECRLGYARSAPCRGVWQGTYVLSADGLPIIGRHPQLENLFLAIGDSGGAFKLAPAIGEDLASVVVGQGGAGEADIASLSPRRLMPEAR